MSHSQDEKQPDASVNLLNIESTPPNSTMQRLMGFLNKYWIVELLCVFVALGSLAGLIGMLSYLNDSTLDAWTLKISPNTILAILANICKAVLVTVIATCIAQLRWSYFASAPQPLATFDTFDGATRGPWGAFMFLTTISLKDKVAMVASLGAVLMICAIAIDPFAQQMLKYETDSVPTTGGPNPATMPSNGGIASGATILGRADAWQSIYGGFLGFEFPLQYDCHTGNCTWPHFVTLGICSTCQNATNLASFQCASDTNCSVINSKIQGTDISMTLKNGSQPLTASTGRAYSLVKSVVGNPYPGGYEDPTLFNFVTAQLLANLSAPVPANFHPKWNLTLCSVKWCARVHENVTVNNGKLYQPDSKLYNLYQDMKSDCVGSKTCQQFVTKDNLNIPGQDNATFHIDITSDSAAIGKLFSFDNDLNTFGNSTWDFGSAFSVTASMFWGADVMRAAANSASTFSDYLRVNHVGTHLIQGTTLVRTTFIRVRWAWIGLPAAMTAITVLFLAAVVFSADSRKASSRYLWKSSTLPLLFYPLNDTEDKHRQHEPLSALAARGNTVRGQFVDNGQGGVTFTMRDAR